MSARRQLPTTNPTPAENHLLAALPPDVFERIAPTLELVPLKLKQFLHKPGEPIRELYFPCGGFVSIVTVLNDGGMVEVATVGREGVVGVAALFNGDPSPSAAMVQVRRIPATGCGPKCSAGRSTGATRSAI
jgi:CRP-like cAMP-binding protein